MDPSTHAWLAATLLGALWVLGAAALLHSDVPTVVATALVGTVRALRATGQATAVAGPRLLRTLDRGLVWLLGAADRGLAWLLVSTGRLVLALVLVLVRAAAWAVAGTVQLALSSLLLLLRATAALLLAAVRLVAALVALSIAVLLAAAVAPAAASAMGGAAAVVAPPEPELPPLAQRSVVRAADGSRLGWLHEGVNRHVVPLDAVPDHVVAAVLTAEDRRFFDHDGVDVIGVGRAALANLDAGDVVAGGSTITQQVAKANFTDGARTVHRKLVELGYAHALETHLGKDAILERYLNEVYFGRGAYGVQAAAEVYFNADVGDLHPDQAALLAGMIRAPAVLDPARQPDRARARRNAILHAMAATGALEGWQAAAVARLPLDAIPARPPQVLDPFIVEQVKRDLLADERLGDDRAARRTALLEGGLEITTTIDPRRQQAAEQALAAAGLVGAPPVGALAALDPATGAIVAARHGRGFHDDHFDLVFQGRRQPGSAFKTFVLVAALERGASLAHPVDASSPATLHFGGDRPWRLRNFGGADLGTLPLGEAFARSSNTAFGRLILQVGQSAVEDVMARLGVDVDAALGVQRGLSPAIALGGVAHGLTPVEMAASVAPMATGGELAAPYLVARVVDADGVVLIDHRPEPQRVLDVDVAAEARAAMRGVVTDGTGGRAELPDAEAFGKTGTSQSFADAWFVGATDDLAAAVWMGHPGARTPMPRVTGGSVPAEAWQAFMSAPLD